MAAEPGKNAFSDAARPESRFQSEGPSGSGDDMAERLGALKQEIAALSDQVATFVQSRAGQLKDSAVDTANQIEGLVRRNPWTAVGAAAGGGLLLALLLTPRRAGHHARTWSPSAMSEVTRADLRDLSGTISGTIRDAFERATSRQTFASIGDKLVDVLSKFASAPMVASAGDKAAAAAEQVSGWVGQKARSWTK